MLAIDELCTVGDNHLNEDTVRSAAIGGVIGVGVVFIVIAMAICAIVACVFQKEKGKLVKFIYLLGNSHAALNFGRGLTLCTYLKHASTVNRTTVVQS